MAAIEDLYFTSFYVDSTVILYIFTLTSCLNSFFFLHRWKHFVQSCCFGFVNCLSRARGIREGCSCEWSGFCVKNVFKIIQHIRNKEWHKSWIYTVRWMIKCELESTILIKMLTVLNLSILVKHFNIYQNQWCKISRIIKEQSRNFGYCIYTCTCTLYIKNRLRHKAFWSSFNSSNGKLSRNHS